MACDTDCLGESEDGCPLAIPTPVRNRLPE
jgi:hypothetical protein